MRRADGVYRWWLIRGVSLHDESGKVISWFGTCTDVDDIKKTQEALSRARDETEAANQQMRESEERFRLTIDEAPIGMALVALDGRFARVNAALCEIVGYPAEELERLRFQEITHPEDLDSDLELVGRLVGGEIPRYQLEKRYIRKDGTVVNRHAERFDPARPRWRAPLLHRPGRRHHGAEAGRGGAAVLGGAVLGDHLHLGRRDHLHRRGATNRPLQRRRREDLRLLPRRGGRGSAGHSASRRPSGRPSPARRHVRRRGGDGASDGRARLARSWGDARTARSSPRRPRSRSCRSTARRS